MVLPPDVGVQFVAVQINVESLSGQNCDAIGLEIKVLDFKSGAHQKKFALAPL